MHGTTVQKMLYSLFPVLLKLKSLWFCKNVVHLSSLRSKRNITPAFLKRNRAVGKYMRLQPRSLEGCGTNAVGCVYELVAKRRHISLNYNQQDATFSRPFYFYKLLYMFQAVPPPIIRSTKLYIQRQVLSNQYCCLLLSWMTWNAVPCHPR